MRIFDMILGRSNKSSYSTTERLLINTQDKITMVFYDYVISICCNKIANALAMCSYSTYENGKEVKNSLWYSLNVEPNLNQNASDFWNKLVFTMVKNQDGALVVNNKDNLLIADDFIITEKAFKENEYSEIQIGDLTLNRRFLESDIYRIKWNNTNLNDLFFNIYVEVGKMLSSSIKNYNRANAKKYLLNIGTQFDQLKAIRDEHGNSQFDTTLDDLFKNRLSQLMGEKDSVTPLEDGLQLQEVKQDKKVEISEIRGLIDDIINIGADAFGIPRGLLKGDIADIEAMTDNFISFCINPLANQIEDEINRKYYKKENIVQGTRLRIKTSKIKSYDPIKLANSAEALFRIRSVNTNWVREMLNEERINEDWADEFMETKNYQNVEKDKNNNK